MSTIVCPGCKQEIASEDIKSNLYICPSCGHYHRVSAKSRIAMLVDDGSFEPLFEDLKPGNPLNIPGYEAKIAQAQEKTGLTEGVKVGLCSIGGNPCVLGVIDAAFFMGSMGQVLGERVTRAVETGTEKKLPVILFCCSGGARMQEGILSLMQMEKTSAALKRHNDAGQLAVTVLTDPTTGGVTASFAMLGDIILAEPGAMIGFAGPRVIEQTIGESLPQGFQRAEFQLEHGFVDRIVPRSEMKLTLEKILSAHKPLKGYANFDSREHRLTRKFKEHRLERKAEAVESKSAWEKVLGVRQVTRLGAVDYIDEIFEDFMEFHGDRYFRDDPAIVGGIAYLDGQPVTVIGVDRGKDLTECMSHNFGMPSPEGYRKAIRLMKQAEKFGRPIVTFVNTSGAYPGKQAEENGQGEAIARNLYEMSAIKVPILSIMIGEGGSGGALALAVGSEVWMLENALYSILSPEGFASILWKDSSRAEEAAELMKITANHLKEMQVIEEVIPEFGGADAETLPLIAADLLNRMKSFLKRYSDKTGEQIAQERYERFRKY